MARHKVEICGVNTANLKVLNNEDGFDVPSAALGLGRVRGFYVDPFG